MLNFSVAQDFIVAEFARIRVSEPHLLPLSTSPWPSPKAFGEGKGGRGVRVRW